MGQTLTNGIYLPDEGEVRCYDGLASNWTTLDVVVGGYRAHIANENIHITSAERSKWNTGVTQAYVLRYASTSLTALGTVAFSSLDNTDNIKIGDKVLDSEGKLFALTAVDTDNSTATLSALLIDLADDSGVVHKAGAESIAGQKIFNDINTGSSSSEIGVSAGNNSFKILDKNKNTIARLEGGTYSSGMAYSYLLVNNGSDVFNGVSIYQQSSSLAQLRPYSSTLSLQLGASNGYFSDCYTSKINSLNPGVLFMPQDRTARLDISSYFTDTANGAVNRYTPLNDGYIFMSLSDVVTVQCFSQTSGNLTHYGQTFSRPNAGLIFCLFPVRKNDNFGCQWYTTSAAVTVTSVFFIPCKGNV